VIRRAAVLSLALVVVPAAAAEAKLPSPKTKLIVPGKSIAGVKVGMDPEDAVAAWGAKGSSCEEVTSTTSCRWDSPKRGSARFDIFDGKVERVVITAGQNSNADYVYKGALVKWKTKKKIGLGSPLNKVAKKYPKAKPTGGGLQLDTGKNATLFSSSAGRTGTIEIVPRSHL
jgi:hypothetical protein